MTPATPPMEHDPRLEETVFAAALQRTHPADRAAFLDQACAGNPELRRRIEALLSAGEQANTFLEQPAGIDDSPTTADPDPSAPSTPSTPADSSPRFHPRGPDSTEGPGSRIGRYRLLQQIGEGGCGTVFMAEQEEPVRRRVALKLIKLGMDTRSVIARFEAERQALAMMDHPHIARVLDAGATASGRPFFVMELVRGIPITRFCDDNRLDTRQRLELFTLVCQAVQHAHQKGIIHRDLKPSNILVTLHDGKPVPKVIDFGIAKATEGRLTDRTLFTAFEQFIGTPAYMSPEQAELSGLDIDTRSDIYSLGVLLYELLTGRTPFDARELAQAGLDEIRRRIREVEPARPSTRLSTLQGDAVASTASARGVAMPELVHLLRGDLDWIVMRCLEKDRARRYETANGLAADIHRHLSDEPVSARPPSTAYRLQKAWRRNRTAATAAAAITLALLAATAISSWQAVRASRAELAQRALGAAAEAARAKESQLRQQAEIQRRTSLLRAYAADMNLAQRSLEQHDLGRAAELLDRYRPGPGEPDLRGWEWRYLWQRCASDAAFQVYPPDGLGTVLLSPTPDGNTLVAARTSPKGAVLQRFDWHRRGIDASPWGVPGLRWSLPSPDPSVALAVIDRERDTELALVAADDGRVLQSLGSSRPYRLVYSADGSIAATRDSSGACVWALPEGRLLARIPAPAHEGLIGMAFALSRDGRRVALPSPGAPGTLAVHDAESGRQLWSRDAADESITALAFSPDGASVISGEGYAGGSIRVWDAATGEPRGHLEGHRGWVAAFEFLNHGATLASGSADQTVRLWDLRTLRPAGVLRGHRAEVWALAIHPMQGTLISASQDGEILAWNPAAAREHRSSLSFSNVLQWQFHDASPALTLIDPVAKAVLRRTGPSLDTVETLLHPGDEYGPHASITPDGDHIAAASGDGTVRLWTLSPPGLAGEFQAHDGPCSVVWIPGEPGFLATIAPNQATAIRWDPRTFRPLRTWSFDPPLKRCLFSPDGRWILDQDIHSTFHLVDTASGERRAVDTNAHGSYGWAFSPDNSLVGRADEPHVTRLWRLPAFEPFAELHGHMLGAKSLAFSPDGRRIATASGGAQSVILWDVESRLEVLTLESPHSMYTRTRFSKDGRMLGISRNLDLTIWTAPTLDEIAALESRLAGSLHPSPSPGRE